jgi:hypothetical protein
MLINIQCLQTIPAMDRLISPSFDLGKIPDPAQQQVGNAGVPRLRRQFLKQRHSSIVTPRILRPLEYPVRVRLS